jgi:hypothetical protein
MPTILLRRGSVIERSPAPSSVPVVSAAPSLPSVPSDLFPLTATAQQVATGLLGPDRWIRTQAVVTRAGEAAGVLPPQQRSVLLAAAWLHDIGYHRALHHSGFHPLDGARYLQAHGWPHLITTLVAHHFHADDVAAVLGLREELDAFNHPQGRSGALPDALTWADQTTGPRGEALSVDQRLSDMLARHGPGSPTPALTPTANRTCVAPSPTPKPAAGTSLRDASTPERLRLSACGKTPHLGPVAEDLRSPVCS